MLPVYILLTRLMSWILLLFIGAGELTEESGIKLRLRKGDMELEIIVSKNVNEKQIAALQKLLKPFAEGLISQRDMKNVNSATSNNSSDLSLYVKLKSAVASAFRYGQWFTSLDAKEAFEDLYGINIKLATCSTYLRRMEEEGFLIARKIGRIVEYRIAEEFPEESSVIASNAYQFDRGIR